MKAKNILIIFILTTIITVITGCSSSIIEKGPSCTLNVVTYYGGAGIDGQDLGSGSFDKKYTAHEGDCFYESFDGKWLLEKNSTENVIVKIEKIDVDGVTINIYKGTEESKEEKRLNYSINIDVPSTFVVCDGTNYNYEIVFSGYSKWAAEILIKNHSAKYKPSGFYLLAIFYFT